MYALTRSMSRVSSAAITASAVCYLLATVVAPLAAIIVMAEPHGELRSVIARGSYNRVFVATLWLSFAAGVLATIAGVSLAAVAATSSRGVARFLLSVSAAVYAAGVVVRTFGWTILLSSSGIVAQLTAFLGGRSNGLLYSPAAVVIGMTYVLAPLAVFAGWATLAHWLRPTFLTARCLGASIPFFCARVFWPRSRGSVALIAAVLVLIGSGFYTTPALLGGGQRDTVVVSAVIMDQINTFGDWRAGSRLALLFLLLMMTPLATLVNFVTRSLTSDGVRPHER